MTLTRRTTRQRARRIGAVVAALAAAACTTEDELAFDRGGNGAGCESD